MKRRQFLSYLATSPAAAASLCGGASYLSMMRSAFAANGKTLVVIFQRGGCDGLNTVIPYGEDEYYSLRPDISIPAPSSSQNSAIDLDGFFGFHPALSPFSEIYQQGDMAILPTVHYPNGNRSHFSSQDFIESGTSNTRKSDGWLNRHLSSFNQSSRLRSASFGELTHSLRGNTKVPTLANLSNVEPGGIDDDVIHQLDTIFKQKTNETQSNRTLINNHGLTMLNNFKNLTSLEYDSYRPSNGATYPDNTYGQQLRQIAFIIKSGLGFEVGTVNHNGWDDHAKQGAAEGRHANRLADFSAGITALYKDLGSQRMNDVVILTMTEFGRTPKQNASKGTDHGNASNWFVIGRGVNGGIYGDWPGLQPEDLYLGRYLKHDIDFRDIVAEVIKNHLGNHAGLTTVIPGHHYQPVGFL